MAKKKQKPRRRSRLSRSREPSRRAYQQLALVDELMRHRRWEEAVAILHDLEPSSQQRFGENDGGVLVLNDQCQGR